MRSINPITTRFSIWDEGGIVLFDAYDVDNLYQHVKYREMGLLLEVGGILTLDGDEKKIVKTDFLISRTPVNPDFETLQIVVTVKDI